MIWVIEIILAFTIIILSNIFWSALRAAIFQRKLLQNGGELSRIITLLGKDKLKLEAEGVQPAFGSYGKNIIIFLSLGIKAMNRTRNFIAVVNVILLAVGFIFLNKWLGIFNLVLFFLVKFTAINNYVKNTIASDIQSIILNIYKWNKVDPRTCEQFCREEKPCLRVLYKIVMDTL